ncbi:MAG: DNA gyrase inhibitor YacG [bacterium]
MEIKCPVCRKAVDWENNPWKPFCSERCKLIDLGAWASEEYFIPGKKEEEEDESGTDREKKEDLKTWSE